MTEREIFNHLFSIVDRSLDTDGVVTSCLARDGIIIADAVSTGIVHAEYALLEKIRELSLDVRPTDVVYVTVQPCSRRSSEEGKRLGDCTANLLAAGIGEVVYAAGYPKSDSSVRRFSDSGKILRQVEDDDIIDAAINLFNSTCADPADHLHR